MGQLPTLTTSELDEARHRLTTRGAEKDQAIVLDSTNTDAGNTPTFRFRPGNVVVLETATGRYREANDATGDNSAAAAVTSAEVPDAGWQSATITTNINGQDVVIVTLAATDDTVAEVVTALNANAIFAANFIADDNGGSPRITSLIAGSGISLLVTSSLATAYGAAGTEDQGEDADYRITERAVDLEDGNGVAINQQVNASFMGDYDTSVLLNLTADARRVLESVRGSSFD